MTTRFVIGFLLLFPFSVSGQLIHDASYSDHSFWKFKAELEGVVLRKDQAALKEMLADKVDLGGDNGCSSDGCTKDQFMNYFFAGQQTEFWNEIEYAMRFGYQRSIDEITGANYFKSPSYRDSIDADNETLILGSNVNIRSKPSLLAEIIETSSFSKYKCDCSILTSKQSTYQHGDDIHWLEIYLKNGDVGYVATKFTSDRHSKDFAFGKVNGEWKIISISWPWGC